MDDIKQLRNKIDEIDEKLVILLEERMEISLRIAEYKRLNNIPILYEDREILKEIWQDYKIDPLKIL